MRRALQRAADLLTPAEYVALDAVFGAGRAHIVGALARFGVFDALADGPATAEALAERTRVNPDALHRALRAASSYGWVSLTADGRFGPTRFSRALQSGALKRTREFALYFTSPSNSAAWADYPETLRTGESAFDRVHGDSVWNWFDRHPDEREMFAHAMMGITVAEAPVIASLDSFRRARHICDVGGGRGTLLSELLVRYPHLHGTLADAQGVLDSARAVLEERGVAGRVSFSTTNFFESVPAGCDTYVLKNVLHDWDDAACARILETVRKAADRGARLLVCEFLVERNSRDPLGTMSDVHMSVSCTDGRERSELEVRRLVESAGWTFLRVTHHPLSSVLEAEAR